MSVLKVYGPILIGFRFIHQKSELLRPSYRQSELSCGKHDFKKFTYNCYLYLLNIALITHNYY